MQEKIRIEKIYECKLLINLPSISYSYIMSGQQAVFTRMSVSPLKRYLKVEGYSTVILMWEY